MWCPAGWHSHHQQSELLIPSQENPSTSSVQVEALKVSVSCGTGFSHTPRGDLLSSAGKCRRPPAKSTHMPVLPLLSTAGLLEARQAEANTDRPQSVSAQLRSVQSFLSMWGGVSRKPGEHSLRCRVRRTSAKPHCRDRALTNIFRRIDSTCWICSHSQMIVIIACLVIATTGPLDRLAFLWQPHFDSRSVCPDLSRLTLSARTVGVTLVY